MATYTNTVFVQQQVAPFGPITLSSTDNLTLNVATGIITTSVKLDLGTSGKATTVKGLLTVDEDATFLGNVNVLGTTTSISSQEVLIADNHVMLNSGYTTVSPQTGGLVVNTLPTVVTANVAATGFVAGIPAGAQPKVFVDGLGATLDVAMNTLVLPQATITVNDTTGFAASGTVYITTSVGVEAVTYTGKTGTTFTGAAGGTGTMSTGGFVSSLAFNVSDLVQVSGAEKVSNDGLFEILTNAGTYLTVRGVGTTSTVQDFTQTQFTADTTVAGVVTKVNVSVIRAGTDGAWEVAYGATSGLTFTDLATGGGGAGTDNLTWTVNQDNVGADEDAALYLDSGNGTDARQGRVTMSYPSTAGNGLTFSFDSAPAVTDYGFGFTFNPTNGGAASGAIAAGSGGQFYFAGGSGGAAGAGAGAPGAGGPITLRGGTGGMGGAGSTSGATGGGVTLSGGVGGMAAGGTAGFGGDLTLSGGLGASGSGIGASLSLAGGGGGNLGAAILTAKNIDIGATAAARSVNIATGGAAQTVVIGSTHTTSSLTLDSGTGVIDIGTGAQARTITIGNAAATAVNLNAIAMTFTTSNALALTDGVATFQLDGAGAATLSGGTSTTIDG